MLIELIKTEKIDLNNLIIQECVQNILCAHREGKHIVITNQRFLKELVGNINLGNSTRATAQSIIQEIRELIPLKDKVVYHCKVDMTSSKSGVIDYDESNKFFVVGYQFFHDSSKSQLTKLLCEDINDYKIYKVIADHYKFINKLSKVNIRFDILNGGGANIKNNFDQIKKTEELCFCILDSDKKHPKSKLGSTANKFSHTNDSASCKHFIIDSHEVESLIPMKIIEDSIINNKLDNSYLFAYEQLNALVTYSEEVKMYFDHKKGITINDMIKLDNKYKDTFWQSSIINAKNFKKRSKCIREMRCECQEPCFAVSGFNTGLLDSCADTISKLSVTKLNMYVTSILKDEWSIIGHRLFSWGCAISKSSRAS